MLSGTWNLLVYFIDVLLAALSLTEGAEFSVCSPDLTYVLIMAFPKCTFIGAVEVHGFSAETYRKSNSRKKKNRNRVFI
ncbi:hypothetical protein O6H91_05G069100 [Diphasiastrum complanatum]|uniref:Uncharacterized protein n=1 Tax=Diphasiastrum complanatum TaxID=34168 RepID=A0ACC2DQ36_DIPCM|nr:hypothetical protein O6H91_Y033100 [Diphasiastrum complanatum]KAJ7556112.1 hypothetical protein O6H91_05G069100 [Diphasiastrum complanatum]